MEATHRTNLTNAVAAHVTAITDELGEFPESTASRLVGLGATEADLDAVMDFALGDSPFDSVGDLVDHLDANN